MALYHALNRGTDKRAIVMDNHDRFRFVTGLHVFNDANPVLNLSRSLSEVRLHSEQVPRERLVDIHGWCLMGNHYHLLLSERVEGGISKFLQKLNVGYTNYFNKRHQRSGVLFQGKTKRIHLKTDAHYLYILLYIHCNPLDLMRGGKEWRTQSLTNIKAALEWIEKYRWSSYRNYTGAKEFVEILSGSELYEDRKGHAAELQRHLRALYDTSTHPLHLE